MIKLGLNGGSLGDALFLTPAINALNHKKETVVVQMHDDEQCRAVSTVFDNLCPVEFVDNPPKPLYHINQDKTHYTQRVLNELGLSKYSCIPKINLKKEEIDWARESLSKLDVKNPTAITNDNSGCHDLNNHRAHYVRPSPLLMQGMVDQLNKQGFTVLQFGRKSDNKFTPLNGVVRLIGSSIRELAAFYSIIDGIVSGDTGDYHLALSVGVAACVLSPDESIPMGYLYDELHYKPYLWKNEEVRCKYVNFNTLKPIY